MINPLLLKIILTILVFHVHSKSTEIKKELEIQYENINNQILSYKRMSFLNQVINNDSREFQTKNSENIYDKIKIRKFTSAKIHVKEELKRLENLQNFYQNEDNQIAKINTKEKYLSNLNFISTVSLTSKKFEGLNLYTHVILQSLTQFYSLEGENLFEIPFSEKNDHITDKLLESKSIFVLISYIKNENFYIAQYENDYSVREDANCLNIRISQIEMRNKRFVINDRIPYNNLLINTQICDKVNKTTKESYSEFFTYGPYQHKPSHYIFTNKNEIHFYIYSEIAQQLIRDYDRTIKLTEIFNNEHEEISTLVKLNTHLIVLTNNNNLFSINLFNFLSMKNSESIMIYETLSLQFEKFHSIHFNDNDFRFFYILADRSIYLYRLTSEKILKKYPLKSIHCLSESLSEKCTQNIWILENYILTQEKNIESTNEFHLIEKNSGYWHEFHLPFSHENKCSNLKKISVSKNKNSHYIVTLTCFIAQKNLENHQTQPSDYIILENLNLETSNEVNMTGELGGIDFTKFRLPMIFFSIGLVCYITVKRSSKKSPQQLAQEEKMEKKFEKEVFSTIRREKERQEALNLARKKT